MIKMQYFRNPRDYNSPFKIQVYNKPEDEKDAPMLKDEKRVLLFEFNFYPILSQEDNNKLLKQYSGFKLAADLLSMMNYVLEANIYWNICTFFERLKTATNKRIFTESDLDIFKNFKFEKANYLIFKEVKKESINEIMFIDCFHAVVYYEKEYDCNDLNCLMYENKFELPLKNNKYRPAYEKLLQIVVNIAYFRIIDILEVYKKTLPKTHSKNKKENTKFNLHNIEFNGIDTTKLSFQLTDKNKYFDVGKDKKDRENLIKLFNGENRQDKQFIFKKQGNLLITMFFEMQRKGKLNNQDQFLYNWISNNFLYTDRTTSNPKKFTRPYISSIFSHKERIAKKNKIEWESWGLDLPTK